MANVKAWREQTFPGENRKGQRGRVSKERRHSEIRVIKTHNPTDSQGEKSTYVTNDGVVSL